MADIGKLVFDPQVHGGRPADIRDLNEMARHFSESPTAQALRKLQESGAIKRMQEEAFRQQAAIRAALGPMEDLRRAGFLNPKSEFYTKLAQVGEVISAYRAQFILPTNTVLIRLVDQRRSNPVREALSRYTTQVEQLHRAISAMRTPWLNELESLRSLTSFAEIQGIGNLINRLPGFDPAVGNALRVDLGDWRDEITFNGEVLADPEARSGLYAELGFDVALTEMPAPAFDESTEIAGLRCAPPDLVNILGEPVPANFDLREDEALIRTNVAHDWLMRLESNLRHFINARMTAQFGEDWPRRQLPNGIYDQWVDKQNKSIKAGRAAGHAIEYADFTDFILIISRNDNWTQVFEPFFRRKEDVRESFQRLYPIRNDTMHSRPIGQDDQLLLYVEVKRIVRAFMN